MKAWQARPDEYCLIVRLDGMTPLSFHRVMSREGLVERPHGSSCKGKNQCGSISRDMVRADAGLREQPGTSWKQLVRESSRPKALGSTS